MDQEKTEKLIMSMVNATVSHELRNPINSIHSQNIMMQVLLKELTVLLEQQ